MSETDTTEVLTDDDRRVYDGAVARVRSARDRAIDLAEAILHATSPNVAFMNPVTEQDREHWRSEIDRLKRMAGRSDIWLREQP